MRTDGLYKVPGIGGDRTFWTLKTQNLKSSRWGRGLISLLQGECRSSPLNWTLFSTLRKSDLQFNDEKNYNYFINLSIETNIKGLYRDLLTSLSKNNDCFKKLFFLFFYFKKFNFLIFTLNTYMSIFVPNYTIIILLFFISVLLLH